MMNSPLSLSRLSTPAVSTVVKSVGVTDLSTYTIDTTPIGQGTFGVVAKAIKDGQTFALKELKLKDEKDGFPITAIREIKILKLMRGVEGIVQLLDIAIKKDANGEREKCKVCLVMEFMDFDLARLLDPKNGYIIPPENVKSYSYQLINAVYNLHQKKIIHRDLKSANVLINTRGQLKLCDFGLSRRIMDDENNNTKKVVTLWYRTPELLLGELKYNNKIDMWAVGCILAEFYIREPLFSSKLNDDNEGQISQLLNIMDVLGPITEENWKDAKNLPDHKYLVTREKSHPSDRRLLERLQRTEKIDPQAFDLIDKLLAYDPKVRLDSIGAKTHSWFDDPKPKKPEELPIPRTSASMMAPPPPAMPMGHPGGGAMFAVPMVSYPPAYNRVAPPPTMQTQPIPVYGYGTAQPMVSLPPPPPVRYHQQQSYPAATYQPQQLPPHHQQHRYYGSGGGGMQLQQKRPHDQTSSHHSGDKRARYPPSSSSGQRPTK